MTLMYVSRLRPNILPLLCSGLRNLSVRSGENVGSYGTDPTHRVTELVRRVWHIALS